MFGKSRICKGDNLRFIVFYYYEILLIVQLKAIWASHIIKETG